MLPSIHPSIHSSIHPCQKLFKKAGDDICNMLPEDYAKWAFSLIGPDDTSVDRSQTTCLEGKNDCSGIVLSLDFMGNSTDH
jgi:hypothetical protein